MTEPITLPLWIWVVLVVISSHAARIGDWLYTRVHDLFQLWHCKKRGHDYDEERVIAVKNDMGIQVYFICKNCGGLSEQLDLSEWPTIACIVEEEMA